MGTPKKKKDIDDVDDADDDRLADLVILHAKDAAQIFKQILERIGKELGELGECQKKDKILIQKLCVNIVTRRRHEVMKASGRKNQLFCVRACD